MKIQLDTNAKTIKVEADVVLKDLVDTLEKILPKGEWKTFVLSTNTVINNWSNPIVIERYRPLDWPWYREIDAKNGYTNKVYSTATDVKAKLQAGTFNVEL